MLRAALAHTLFARVDDRLQLRVAPDERRLDSGAAPRSACAGDDTKRRVDVNGLLAALDVVDPSILVDDRGLAGAPRDVVHEHGSRLCQRLETRGGVDAVAEDHPFALGADLDCGAPGQHARADTQLGHADLLAQS